MLTIAGLALHDSGKQRKIMPPSCYCHLLPQDRRKTLEPQPDDRTQGLRLSLE